MEKIRDKNERGNANSRVILLPVLLIVCILAFSSVCWCEENDSLGYCTYEEDQKTDVVTVVKENGSIEKLNKEKYGVTINKLDVKKKSWDPYNKNTRMKLDGFVNRSKTLTEKEMMKKWIDFVEKDLHMGFLNNAVVRGVILAPVGFVIDQVTRLKKKMNVKSKFEGGNLYLYKGKKF
ncbi:hypothetical protein KAJ27_14540 [bacterium]|nr:hypothetical protein [bacterium]